MRNLFCACVALLLAAAASASPAFADFRVDPTDLTVSEVTDLWSNLATTIDTAGTAAQRRGDASLAQQQFLLGAMARRLAGEFRSTQLYSLVVRTGDLPSPLPDRVKAADAALAGAAAASESSAGVVLKDVQDKANALLAVAMKAKHYPVLYGMLARDVAANPAAEPADLMIYGYDVRDEAVEKNPVVTVGRIELPGSAVRVENNILLITLPDEVKKAIGFAPSACTERNTFGVRVRAFYAVARGLWPLQWNVEQSTVADFNALATPDVYSAKITYSVDSVRKSVAKESFVKKSGFVAAECDQTASTSMTIDLPPGSQDVSCEARWVDTSSAKSAQANCAVGSSGATASGTLSGLAKICSFGTLCSCVSSAHGWLEAKGAYQRNAETIEPVDRTLPEAPSFGQDASASVALPLAAGETLRGVSIALSRRACPEILDSIEISTPGGQAPTLPASSRTGAFRALYAGGKLLVGGFNADAFNSSPSQ